MSPVSPSASRVWTISGRPVWRAAAIWARKLSACSVARAVLVVEVEAGLADADDLGMARRLDQAVGVRCPSSLPRADGRRPSTRCLAWRSAMARTSSNWSSRVPMVSMPRDAGRPGARQHAGLVARQARESRDGSGCRSASVPRFAARRSAGTRPAASGSAVPGTSSRVEARRTRLVARPARQAGRGSCPPSRGMKGCTSSVDAPDRLGQHPQHRVAPHRIGLGAAPTAPAHRRSGWRRRSLPRSASARDGRPARRVRRARRPAAPLARSSRAVSASVIAPLAGTLPPQFLATIDSTRWQRLP